MLKTILSISGKPGLYKLVSHGKNMLIVESLTDNKRVPAYAKDKVISLGDIAIYTDETEVPLHEVLTSVKNKEEGKAASLVPSKATTDQLRAYFAEVLPSYDRERVYPSDIKKLLSWYNILINAGITDFTPEDAPLFQQLHDAPWEEDVVITPYFTLHKHRADFEEVNFHEYFDMVFFDAFAPEKQPEMWNEQLFRSLYVTMNTGGILTTYCAKGVIRRLLQAVGFRVERLPGPPGGKREILRATKVIGNQELKQSIIQP